MKFRRERIHKLLHVDEYAKNAFVKAYVKNKFSHDAAMV